MTKVMALDLKIGLVNDLSPSTHDCITGPPCDLFGQSAKRLLDIAGVFLIG